MSATDRIADAAPGSGVARVEEILARLRGPSGCPWDGEQTLASLKPCLLEEAYELLEAMDGDDPKAHAEELGDVLLQVVFQSRIREEQGHFTLDEVAHQLANKLIRRHPHVFGTLAVQGSDEVLRNWEEIKRTEKDRTRSALDGVPRALPALARAQRIQTKASRVGFDWPDASGPQKKIAEELAELAAATATGDQTAIRHEVGDLLFSVVNLCRFLKIDAEEALQETDSRFIRRFMEVERRVQNEGRALRDCPMQVLDAHWDAVKAGERN